MAAGAVYLWLPVRSSALLEAAVRPARADGPITIRAGEPNQRPDVPGGSFPFGAGMSLSIPLETTGISTQRQLGLRQLDFEIDAPGGLRFEADRRVPGTPRRNSSLIASIMGFENRYHLNLLMDRSVFSRVSGVPVVLKGHFVADEISPPVGRAIPNNARTDVPDLGKCVVSVADDNIYQEGGLRVACESPAKIPPAHVALTDTVTGRHWDGALGARTFVSYPTLTWLSPLNRSEAYFQLISADTGRPGDWWKVPRGTLQHYRLDADIRRVTGTKVVGYELPGIQLRRFVLTSPR
jgi:hypothetical protein